MAEQELRQAAAPPATQTGDVGKVLAEHHYQIRDLGPAWVIKCGCGWESSKFDDTSLVYSAWDNHFMQKLASAAPTPEPTGAEYGRSKSMDKRLKAQGFVEATGADEIVEAFIKLRDDIRAASACNAESEDAGSKRVAAAQEFIWLEMDEILKGKFTLAAQPGQKGESKV
jgi:hypothetical protein